MQFRIAMLGILLALALAGCGKPVPADKLDFVGEWKHAEMTLVLSKDGNIQYRRIIPGGSKSAQGPLQGFEGNDFKVGVGPMSTTFHVSVPPHRAADGSWRMTVDGLEVVRNDLAAP